MARRRRVRGSAFASSIWVAAAATAAAALVSTPNPPRSSSSSSPTKLQPGAFRGGGDVCRLLASVLPDRDTGAGQDVVSPLVRRALRVSNGRDGRAGIGFGGDDGGGDARGDEGSAGPGAGPGDVGGGGEDAVAADETLRTYWKQRQKHIDKSRRNNKAMADPDFLRKRTQSLLASTDVDRENFNFDLSSGGHAHGGGLKADKKTFDFLINAWAYSSEDAAADHALELLRRMESLRDLGHRQIAPDVKTYAKVINALAMAGREDGGVRAEALLDYMKSDEGVAHGLRPNTLAYTHAIDAHARSHSAKAPFAAQRLIEEMEALRSKGDPDVRPTARAWNSVIVAWSAWRGEEMAWGRVGSGAERAEACLAIMEEWADATGNEDTRPNSYNYNSVISALANSQEDGAAARAENILQRMEGLYRETGDEDVKPRTATYNAIIDVWAKSGEYDAADRAELLLGHMMELYEMEDIVEAKPNVRSFNSVLNAWAKSGHPAAPQRALDVLSRMEDLDASGELSVSPDATSFATTINAYARSRTFGKAQNAYEIFLHMKELYDMTGKPSLRPNNVVYNSVLNACAFSVGDLEEQSRSIEIANAMLVDINGSPYAKPDQVTYGTYLKVVNNQIPFSESRDRVVETIFRRCARDGMVGEMVMKQMREMGKDDVYENLAGRTFWGDARLADLPSSWTCNVIEGKKRRRWRQFRR